MSGDTSDDRPLVIAVLGAGQPGPPEPETVRIHPARTENEVAARLHEARAVVFWEFLGPLLDASWREDLALDWVHVAGAGLDRILFPGLIDSDVVVTNARGVFDGPVAEYALGLVIALAKRFPQTLSLQREALWHHRRTDRLAGSRLLVVGPGAIGTCLGVKARALGMTVTAVGRRARPDGEVFNRVHGVEDLVRLVGSVDHVVLTAPLTDATRHLLGAEIFASFQGATLVNVGRGELVDEDALLEALESGRVSAAALDVFEEEPLPTDSPLWAHPGILVSPHMSANVAGVEEELVEVWSDNLHRWLAGLPLRNVVDKRLGYVPG